MVEVNIRNIYKNRGAKSARKIPQIFCTTLRIGSSPTIIHILAPFAIIFSCSKTWTKAALLMTGAILCKGGRTVCGALKVLGLQGEKAFTNYHRVLNRAQWNALKGAKILLMQTISTLGITELVVALDDHIERRSGEKINSKGCYRDAVRSSRGFIVRCFGLKWVAQHRFDISSSSRCTYF